MIKTSTKNFPAVSAKNGGASARSMSAKNGSSNAAKAGGAKTGDKKEETRLVKKKALTLAAFAAAYDNHDKRA